MGLGRFQHWNMGTLGLVLSMGVAAVAGCSSDTNSSLADDGMYRRYGSENRSYGGSPSSDDPEADESETPRGTATKSSKSTKPSWNLDRPKPDSSTKGTETEAEGSTAPTPSRSSGGSSSSNNPYTEGSASPNGNGSGGTTSRPSDTPRSPSPPASPSTGSGGGGFPFPWGGGNVIANILGLGESSEPPPNTPLNQCIPRRSPAKGSPLFFTTGMACGMCHDSPKPIGKFLVFPVAGTVYSSRQGGQPVPGVTIDVIDANGKRANVVTSDRGNFALRESVTPPFWVKVSGCPSDVPMHAQAPHGNCNAGGCHDDSNRIYIP